NSVERKVRSMEPEEIPIHLAELAEVAKTSPETIAPVPLPPEQAEKVANYCDRLQGLALSPYVVEIALAATPRRRVDSAGKMHTGILSACSIGFETGCETPRGNRRRLPEISA